MSIDLPEAARREPEANLTVRLPMSHIAKLRDLAYQRSMASGRRVSVAAVVREVMVAFLRVSATRATPRR